MEHETQFQRQSQNEFAKRFSSLCKIRSPWSVWSDFVTMTAILIMVMIDREKKAAKMPNWKSVTYDIRVKEFEEIQKRYLPEERDVLNDLMEITMDALYEDPNQDFLGEIFMSLGLNTHCHGQHFTPYHTARLMARTLLDDADKSIARSGWVGIIDSSCGTGTMLIAAWNELKRQGNGCFEGLYLAKNTNRTVALTCYIQLAFLHCAAVVIVGDEPYQPETTTFGAPSSDFTAQALKEWATPDVCIEPWPTRLKNS